MLSNEQFADGLNTCTNEIKRADLELSLLPLLWAHNSPARTGGVCAKIWSQEGLVSSQTEKDTYEKRSCTSSQANAQLWTRLALEPRTRGSPGERLSNRFTVGGARTSKALWDLSAKAYDDSWGSFDRQWWWCKTWSCCFLLRMHPFIGRIFQVSAILSVV